MWLKEKGSAPQIGKSAEVACDRVDAPLSQKKLRHLSALARGVPQQCLVTLGAEARSGKAYLIDRWRVRAPHGVTPSASDSLCQPSWQKARVMMIGVPVTLRR